MHQGVIRDPSTHCGGWNGGESGRLVLLSASISWFLAMDALTSRAEEFLLIESAPEKSESLIHEGQCN